MNNEEKQLRATIARRIKEVRTAKGLSQHDLAKAADLVQGTISQYESGHIVLDIYALIRICDGLGCTIDYLLGRDSAYDQGNLRGRLFTAFSVMGYKEQEQVVRMLEFLVRK